MDRRNFLKRIAGGLVAIPLLGTKSEAKPIEMEAGETGVYGDITEFALDVRNASKDGAEVPTRLRAMQKTSS